MRIEVYEDEGGKWRWRLRAANARVQAVSGESFASRSNAKRAADRMADLLRFPPRGVAAYVEVV